MKKEILFIVLGILVIGVGGYYWLGQKGDNYMPMPPAPAPLPTPTNVPPAPPASPNPSPIPPAPVSVEILNYQYSPKTISVKVGTTVTWTNKDTIPHTVTASGSNGGPDSTLFGLNGTYSYTFDKAGTYDYYCKPHPYMKGTVVVTN